MVQPDISLVIPAHNEEESIEECVREAAGVLDRLDRPYEVLVVDDGSSDGTFEVLKAVRNDLPQLRALRFKHNRGQSAAMDAGFHHAAGDIVVTMDADLQNDPADLPAMLDTLRRTGADMVHGDRYGDRRDTFVRRGSSAVGRAFRRCLLGDTIRDTGCSLRLFKREIGLQLPLQYKGMHRFIPVYSRMLGYRVVEMPVHHRPRTAGQAKYGIWNRLRKALPNSRPSTTSGARLTEPPGNRW